MHAHQEAEIKRSGLTRLYGYKYPDPTVTVKLEGQTVKRELSPVDYNKVFNTTFTTGVVYDPNIEKLVQELKRQLREQVKTAREDEKKSVTAVKNYLANPKNYFEIHYISKNFRYGIKAKEKIPKGTVLGIYSGKLLIEDVSQPSAVLDHDYGMTVHEFEYKNKTYKASIDAKPYGDHTRAAPHLPSGVGKPVAPPINKSSIRKANIHWGLKIDEEGNPYMCYIADRDIEKGEFTGIDYGPKYWIGRKITPDLLMQDHEGDLVVTWNEKQERYEMTNEKIPTDVPHVDVLVKKPLVEEKKSPPTLLPRPTADVVEAARKESSKKIKTPPPVLPRPQFPVTVGNVQPVPTRARVITVPTKVLVNSEMSYASVAASGNVKLPPAQVKQKPERRSGSPAPVRYQPVVVNLGGKTKTVIVIPEPGNSDLKRKFDPAKIPTGSFVKRGKFLSGAGAPDQTQKLQAQSEVDKTSTHLKFD